MRYGRFVAVLCLVVFMLSACTGRVSYTEKEDEPLAGLSDKGGQDEEESRDMQNGGTEKDGDTKDVDSSPEGFQKVEAKSYDRDALHRTCAVSFSTHDAKKREDMWERIMALPSCRRSRKLFCNRNVMLDIPLENINPEFLEFYEKISPDGYKRMKEAGVYDLPVAMYTYEGCDRVMLCQSNSSIERKGRKPEDCYDYAGGFITNLVEGSRVKGRVENPMSGTVVEFPSELELESLRTTPEWFWDTDGFDVYIQVPYEEYFVLTGDDEEETPPWYVVQSVKGKEKKMRQEIEEITGSWGCVLENAYYK